MSFGVVESESFGSVGSCISACLIFKEEQKVLFRPKKEKEKKEHNI